MDRDDVHFAAFLIGGFVTLILGVVCIIALAVTTQYKAAFEHGYSEVQTAGTTNTHWEKETN